MHDNRTWSFSRFSYLLSLVWPCGYLIIYCSFGFVDPFFFLKKKLLSLVHAMDVPQIACGWNI